MDVAAFVADSFPPRCINSVQSKIGGHGFAVRCFRHIQNQHAIAVSCIGQNSIDRLIQNDLSKVRTYGPLADRRFSIMLARPSLLPHDGHRFAVDRDAYILCFEPGHWSGQHDLVFGLIDPHRPCVYRSPK